MIAVNGANRDGMLDAGGVSKTDFALLGPADLIPAYSRPPIWNLARSYCLVFSCLFARKKSLFSFRYGSRTLEPQGESSALEAIEMAEWLYDIQRLNSVTDAELREILRERGLEGWELVQIIPPSGSGEQIGYRLIFKSQNAPIGGSPS